MNNCLFCKIISGQIPSKKVYEDDYVYAFYDINPQAPVHVLVLPKEHISCANDITAENSNSVARVFQAIPKIASELGISSYRLINNCGPLAGQTVMHLHIHLLSGKQMSEGLI